MVAAGSVVLCDSVLPDADACGVAIRVAGRCTLCHAHRRHFRRAVHHILEVVVAGHEVVLRRVVRAGLSIRIRVTAAPRGATAGRMPTGHSLAPLADVPFLSCAVTAGLSL